MRNANFFLVNYIIIKCAKAMTMNFYLFPLKLKALTP